ncbi:MAG: transcription elongation factor GreA [Elusimicrobiales bacterium]
METAYITREGYEKLRNELDNLRKEKAELSAEIGEAASQGDLRENAAYTYAKEKQAVTLRRIEELESRLRGARLIDDVKVDKTKACIGATVTLQTPDGAQTAYTLSGADEADPEQGKISVSSPMALSILGRREGDKFTATLPKGSREFTVVRIEYR